MDNINYIQTKRGEIMVHIFNYANEIHYILH